MRVVIAVSAVIAITVAACGGSQPVALDTPPPPQSSDDPMSTGSVAQAPVPAQMSASAAQRPIPAAPAPMSQGACPHQQAAEIIRVQQTLQTANDPCVIYWRSIDVRQHPERAFYLECNGLKAYADPQPRGHPVPLAECDRKLRERQQRMGVPVTGLTDEEKAAYRATWGN